MNVVAPDHDAVAHFDLPSRSKSRRATRTSPNPRSTWIGSSVLRRKVLSPTESGTWNPTVHTD